MGACCHGCAAIDVLSAPRKAASAESPERGDAQENHRDGADGRDDAPTLMAAPPGEEQEDKAGDNGDCRPEDDSHSLRTRRRKVRRSRWCQPVGVRVHQDRADDLEQDGKCDQRKTDARGENGWNQERATALFKAGVFDLVDVDVLSHAAKCPTLNVRATADQSMKVAPACGVVYVQSAKAPILTLLV
jgi:hypothetical protein